jgi:uncharacterized protein (DUF983 family)
MGLRARGAADDMYPIQLGGVCDAARLRRHIRERTRTEIVMRETGTALQFGHAQDGAGPTQQISGRFGAPRPLWPAVLRGLRCRCPACGQGRLFGRFLKPVEICRVCKESYSGQRADDFPPYLVVLLLGHILVPTVIAVDRTFAPPLWLYMTFGSTLVALLAVALLQPVKGAVIAYQWACQMGGSDAAAKDLERKKNAV